MDLLIERVRAHTLNTCGKSFSIITMAGMIIGTLDKTGLGNTFAQATLFPSRSVTPGAGKLSILDKTTLPPAGFSAPDAFPLHC